MKKTMIFAALSLLVCACTPTQATRGNIVEDYRLQEITPGVSTRQNVLQSLGSPTTQATFDDSIWYYIGQKTEKRGIFDPKVIEEKIVVVTFTPDGIVETAEVVPASRIAIPRVREKTPTGGNEVTPVQQILGNIGKFNKPVGDSGR